MESHLLSLRYGSNSEKFLKGNIVKKQAAWIKLETKFNEHFDSSFTKDQLETKVKNIKSAYAKFNYSETGNSTEKPENWEMWHDHFKQHPGISKVYGQSETIASCSSPSPIDSPLSCSNQLKQTSDPETERKKKKIFSRTTPASKKSLNKSDVIGKLANVFEGLGNQLNNIDKNNEVEEQLKNLHQKADLNAEESKVLLKEISEGICALNKEIGRFLQAVVTSTASK